MSLSRRDPAGFLFLLRCGVGLRWVFPEGYAALRAWVTMGEVMRSPREVVVSTVGRVSASSRDLGELSRAHWRTSVPWGVLDEVTRGVFLRGQCHSFAAALAEQPGWGRVVVLVEREVTSRGAVYDMVLHCYAVSPDGFWVDVEGAVSDGVALAAWRRGVSAPVLAGSSVEVAVVDSDARGVRALASWSGCAQLGLRVETPLLPTCMPLARSIVPLVC